MRKLREILHASVGTTSLLVAVISCSESPVVGCNLNGIPPISVDVRDAVTGLPAAYSATLVLTLGAETKTVDPFVSAGDSLTAERIVGLVPEFFSRPGVYDVRVERPGYQPWVRNRVVVAAVEGQCTSIETVVLTALLVRNDDDMAAADALRRR